MYKNDFRLIIKNKIRNPKIANLVIKAFEKTPDEFFEVGASSTGKNHPPSSNGEGGLWRHTCMVAFIAKTFLEMGFSPIKSNETKDLVIAACFLHDAVKRGYDGKVGYDPRHPILVKGLLKDEELTPEEVLWWDEICFIASSHMDKYNKIKGLNETLPLPETPEQKIVSFSDMLASRKALNFDYELFAKESWIEVEHNIPDFASNAKSADEKKDEIPAYKLEPATAAQLKFAENLLKQKGEKISVERAEEIKKMMEKGLTKGEANEIISELKEL